MKKIVLILLALLSLALVGCGDEPIFQETKQLSGELVSFDFELPPGYTKYDIELKTHFKYKGKIKNHYTVRLIEPDGEQHEKKESLRSPAKVKSPISTGSTSHRTWMPRLYKEGVYKLRAEKTPGDATITKATLEIYGDRKGLFNE